MQNCQIQIHNSIISRILVKPGENSKWISKFCWSGASWNHIWFPLKYLGSAEMELKLISHRFQCIRCSECCRFWRQNNVKSIHFDAESFVQGKQHFFKILPNLHCNHWYIKFSCIAPSVTKVIFYTWIILKLYNKTLLSMIVNSYHCLCLESDDQLF